MFTSNISSQSLQNSDRYIAKAETKNDRDMYDITNVAWGFLPFNDIANNIGTYTSTVSTIQSEGRTLHARIEFDAGWQKFVDYCEDSSISYSDHEVKNMDQEGYEYSWFEGATYKSKSPNWISSHSPEFLKFLKFQVDYTLTAPVDIFMMDAQTSSALTAESWGNGDFSTHCMKAFREYLDSSYTTSELSAMGISNISTFNYYDFLVAEGITSDAEYTTQTSKHWQTPVPLFDEYQLFQNRALKALTKEVSLYIKSKVPNAIVGTSSPFINPIRSTNIDEIDYYMLEMYPTVGEYILSATTLYQYAELLEKRVVASALPGIWKEVLDGNIDEYVAQKWLVEAYANGANFIFPVNQYAHGTDSYDPTIDYTYLSDFIMENKTLFDGYKMAASEVGVIISRKALKSSNMDMNEITNALKSYNIPYNLIEVGDEYDPTAPSFDNLGDYEKVIVPTNVYNYYLANDGNAEPKLTQLGNKLVKWDKGSDAETAISELTSGLDIGFTLKENGTDINNKIEIFPRVADASKPYVMHLVNSDYNTQTKRFNSHKKVSVSFNVNSFPAAITSATIHLDDGASQTLTTTTASGVVTLESIDSIGLWGILELSHDSQTSATVDIFAPNENIEIYPNPFTSKLFINYTLEKDSDVSISIFDTESSLIATVVEEQGKERGDYRAEWSAEGFRKGTYIVKSVVDGKVSMEKVFYTK